MEKELNIAAILKDKPENTKLWCSIYGEAYLKKINSNKIVNITHHGGYNVAFTENGKSWNDGECVLFPSKSMRDWSKFAWKKGDVLVSDNNKVFVVYNRFANEDYTMFKISYVGYKDGNIGSNDSFYNTADYHKVSKEDAKEFIKSIEVQFGGKLNLSTLEIEKSSEFKDGDIVVLDESEDSIYVKCILILKAEDKGEGVYSFYAFLNTFRGNVEFNDEANHDGKLRLATTEEKKQLFDAIAKVNKAWDAEKKAIVDLPKKCEFKPMDWCLMRDFGEKWKLCQFAFKEEEPATDQAPYNAVGGNWFNECIPYKEDTSHLIGTTDDWKGGEA